MYISIKTKFVLLLSLLIAILLAVQFYFNQKAQNDLLDEIERLSASINKATDAHFRGVLKSLQEKRIPGYPNKVNWIETKVFNDEDFNDSLYVKIHEEILRLSEWDINLSEEFERDVERLLDDREILILKDKNLSSKKNIIQNKIKDLRKTTPYVFEEIWVQEKKDSADPHKKRKYYKDYTFNVGTNKNRIRAVDINLNWTGRPKKKIDSEYNPLLHVNKLHKTSVYSFTIPDYSIPDKPKFLRYNYNTTQLNASMQDLRNRNLLFTTLLFVVSIFGVYFISRRFTKPIHSLKTAFENVEEGNLDVSISSKTKDEIGDLTNSFNHMVNELQKNREREKILKRKEKLASLGTLAAGVAHEIKNPLNAINLTIEHLQDKFIAPEDKQAQQYIHTIQGEIRRLDKVVNNFLSFIRCENLEKRKTDVNKLLTDVIQLFHREFETQGIAVETKFSPNFIYNLDAERYRTVLMNIILNSIQAMSESGVLKIISDAEMKTITIKDSGTGISKDRADSIFDLFYTTKSSGTGLGLPTAYKIVKEHGGDIQIKSEVDRGTEVIINL